MKLLDRTIEAFAPQWACRRAASRAMLGEFREFSASSGSSLARQARAGRLDRSWPRQMGITGQTLQDRYELRSMRDRSRHLDDTNPIAKGILNRLLDNVIGEGFALSGKTKSEQFNLEVDGRFEEWMEDADVRGLLSGREQLRRFYRGHECDGDGGLVLASFGGQPRLQNIQSDQIFQPDGTAQTPTFVDGVEMDANGRPIQFHVLDCPQGGIRKFTPVPAENFIFFPRFNRYGNNVVRGESAFNTSYTLFDQLDGYVDGVVVAARMATVFGLLIKEETASQQAGGLSSLGPQGPQTADQRLAVRLENGMVKYMGTKGQVAQVQASQPMQQTPDFIAAILRLIGLPVDMPLELVLLDFSRVNYSSARAAFLQFYQAMIPKQQYFRTKVMSRIYRW
jgi:capsid protein